MPPRTPLVAILDLLDGQHAQHVQRLALPVHRAPREVDSTSDISRSGVRVLGEVVDDGQSHWRHRVARATDRDVESHPEVITTPGLLIFKPEGGLYFANARQVVDRMRSLAVGTEPAVRVLLVDMSAVPDLETTAAMVLDEFVTQLDESGIELWLSRLTVRPLEMLGRTGTLDRLEGRRFRTVADAVARFESTSGPGERGNPGRASPGG